ncbi:MAG: efflux RND transporter periplasmic adaptor subunit [Gammaproteobacteria bacterium]|nr:efflux RND transporter periplasmic adaptor subunit [Gammaproteobacteria bacterium]
MHYKTLEPPLILALGTALLALAGCGDRITESGARPAPEVEVVELQASMVERVEELPGRVVAAQIAEVRPQVSGVIVERSFQQGAAVEAGQVLYQIDESRYRAALDRAKAELNRARAATEAVRLRERRLASLLGERSVSQQDYDNTAAELRQREAEIELAEAGVQSASIDVDYTRVAAPIDGIVGPALITTGAVVTANQPEPLTRVTALDPIYVDIRLPVSDLRRLRSGNVQADAIELVLDDGSTYAQPGRLEVRDVSVEPGTATVTLRAAFANPEASLLPGLFVSARVTIERRDNAILAPQRGISRNPRGEAQAVVVDADGNTELRTVITSSAIGSDWLIESGLDAGERIVVAGLQKFQPGDRVRPVAHEPSDTGQHVPTAEPVTPAPEREDG